MDEKKVVVVNEEEAIAVEEKAESKGIIKKIGSGVKAHWKTGLLVAGAFVVGTLVGKRHTNEEDDYETVDDSESSNETEESN